MFPTFLPLARLKLLPPLNTPPGVDFEAHVTSVRDARESVTAIRPSPKRVMVPIDAGDKQKRISGLSLFAWSRLPDEFVPMLTCQQSASVVR